MPCKIITQLPKLYGFAPEELSFTEWESGRLAFHAQCNVDDNPHPKDTVPFSEWKSGFIYGEKEMQNAA